MMIIVRIQSTSSVRKASEQNNFNSSQIYVFLFLSPNMAITEVFMHQKNSLQGFLQFIDRTGFTLHSLVTIKREESFGLYLQNLVLFSNVRNICRVESNQCYSADEKSEGERTNNQYFFPFQILILPVFVFLFAQDLLCVSPCPKPDFDLLYFFETVIGYQTQSQCQGQCFGCWSEVSE